MRVVETDIVIVGGGGAGLRAALAAAETAPDLRVALLSKVYPMRSHTVAAEGGAAGVTTAEDTHEDHFRDTVAGGEWLCDQEVVDFFVSQATAELVQLERWGCPWSREEDGSAAVRRFGGMKTARTWFAADKTGFHILHTLFQTSLRQETVTRFDEFFCTHLLVDDGRCHGVVALEIKTGVAWAFLAPSVILATGGAGRVFRFNTNGGIVTGDGMALAWREGVALRDMEFVQVHPTGLLGSGVLITEASRGEGGVLLNRDGRRYLQDYGLGPATPPGQPENKRMELGPRDRLSQAFWHEQRAGRTVKRPLGEAVLLDLRHLGRGLLEERLPQVLALAERYAGVDPTQEAIPVRPAVHYTMGGIATDRHTATSLPGLYAAGECASVGLHGANRLGSNSLTEVLVFGRVAGEQAAAHAREIGPPDPAPLRERAAHQVAEVEGLRGARGEERVGPLRNALTALMDETFGVYRLGGEMERGLAEIRALRERAGNLGMTDPSRAFNQEILGALELSMCLDVAESIAAAALAREESRGAHQRLDDFDARDDDRFLRHSLVTRSEGGSAEVDHAPVNITRYEPAARHYGGEE